MTDSKWKYHGVRVVKSDELDTNTAQTQGMNRAAAITHARAGAEKLWAGTVNRARELDPALLHESVAGEWSFIETLRHLVFATDAWIRRAMLGDPSPWDPLDLPWDEMPETAGISRERARMATGDVLPPTSMVNPRVFLRLNWDRTEGVRFRLITMTGSGTSR